MNGRKVVLTPADVAGWLIERRDNCTRIAVSKVGPDKVGWIEDVAYFQAAIQVCTDNSRLRGLIEGMGHENDCMAQFCSVCNELASVCDLPRDECQKYKPAACTCVKSQVKL